MHGDHLRTVRSWLDASPAETLGLAVLASGAVAVALLVWWVSLPRAAGDASPSPPVPTAGAAAEGSSGLTVHVDGAVHRPGVLALPAGARVHHAIDAAGGARPDALLAALNLARLLEDGERVVVPSVADAGAAGGTAAPADGSTGADGRVDLNRATAAELEELPGIGPVLAQRIESWREQHGPFTEVGQLREVPGIGERTFQGLAELVTV